MAQVKAHKNYICDLWVGDWINIVAFFYWLAEDTENF